MHEKEKKNIFLSFVLLSGLRSFILPEKHPDYTITVIKGKI